MRESYAVIAIQYRPLFGDDQLITTEPTFYIVKRLCMRQSENPPKQRPSAKLRGCEIRQAENPGVRGVRRKLPAIKQNSTVTTSRTRPTGSVPSSWRDGKRSPFSGYPIHRHIASVLPDDVSVPSAGRNFWRTSRGYRHSPGASPPHLTRRTRECERERERPA